MLTIEGALERTHHSGHVHSWHRVQTRHGERARCHERGRESNSSADTNRVAAGPGPEVPCPQQAPFTGWRGQGAKGREGWARWIQARTQAAVAGGEKEDSDGGDVGAKCRGGKGRMSWLGPDSAQRPGKEQTRWALGPRSNASSRHTRQNASPRRESKNADGKPAMPFFPDLVD